MIDTDLSLNLSNISPGKNHWNRKHANPNHNKQEEQYSEPLPLATSTPRTRNGSVMKGTFDKNHKLQAVSLLGIRAYARCQSHEAQSEASNELMN